MPARMLSEVIYHNYIIWFGVGGEEEEEEAREQSLQRPDWFQLVQRETLFDCPHPPLSLSELS